MASRKHQQSSQHLSSKGGCLVVENPTPKKWFGFGPLPLVLPLPSPLPSLGYSYTVTSASLPD